MKMVFRPLTTWPQPKTARPVQSQFKSTWTSTLDLLESEIERLMTSKQRAQEVLLEVDAPASAMRLDGGLRADARVNFHGVIVSFESKYGPQSYAVDKFSSPSWQNRGDSPWKDNVRAIALGLTDLRRLERYGVADSGRQYRGWNALGSGTPMPAAMTVEQAADLLVEHGESGGTRGDPSMLIDDPSIAVMYFRSAAKRHHPDQGGDPDLFRRLTAARDLIAGAS